MTNVVIKFVLTVNSVKRVITWSVLRFLQNRWLRSDIMTAGRVPYCDRARWRAIALDDDECKQPIWIKTLVLYSWQRWSSHRKPPWLMSRACRPAISLQIRHAFRVALEQGMMPTTKSGVFPVNRRWLNPETAKSMIKCQCLVSQYDGYHMRFNTHRRS